MTAKKFNILLNGKNIKVDPGTMILDAAKDRMHPVKKNRPIPAGKIPQRGAGRTP